MDAKIGGDLKPGPLIDHMSGDYCRAQRDAGVRYCTRRHCLDEFMYDVVRAEVFESCAVGCALKQRGTRAGTVHVIGNFEFYLYSRDD